MVELDTVLLTLIRPSETGIEYIKPLPGSVILPARAILVKTSFDSARSTTHQTNSFPDLWSYEAMEFYL